MIQFIIKVKKDGINLMAIKTMNASQIKRKWPSIYFKFHNNHLLYPWTCQPIDRDWVKNSNNDIINFAKLTSDIIDLLKYAYSTKSPPISGFDNYYIQKFLLDLLFIYDN